MSNDLYERIRAQFSYQSSRADIWKVFDAVLDTQEFLNLGYSQWYQPHFLGSSQLRLARKIGTDLATRLPATDGIRLLDIGCGRGGPAIYFADALGFDVIGVDLVPYNVAVAADNAATHGISAEFIISDATSLPCKPDSIRVCTALDSIVYVPEKRAVFDEMATVVRSGGFVALSDLVMRDGLDKTEIAVVDQFADAWDMPSLPSLDCYQRTIEQSGLTVLGAQDISPYSVAQLRKWTTLYLLLVDNGLGDAITRLITRRGLNEAAITDQIRHAHRALPYLHHVNICARNE